MVEERPLDIGKPGFFQHTSSMWRIKGKAFCTYYLGEKVSMWSPKNPENKGVFHYVTEYICLSLTLKDPRVPSRLSRLQGSESHINQAQESKENRLHTYY